MKTAITLLQEMMMKLGQTPEYECISQSGPQHLSTFEYKCVAGGETAHGIARSKKEAKQEAARGVLAALARRGHAVPLDSMTAPTPAPASASAPAPRCHVALLRELAEEYRLPAVEYELVADTGPPHMRRFTMRASIAEHARLASATTKKLARDLAAEQLYTYLRENLRVTRDFYEEEALARAHEKAMERWTEIREQTPWRPDLSQRVSEYHLALGKAADDKVARALEALEAGGVMAAAEVLGLQLEAAADELGPATLTLAGSTPPLVFAGRNLPAAEAAAARYLRLALDFHSPARSI